MGDVKEEGSGSEQLFQLVECVHAPYGQLLVRYPVTMETNALKHKLHGVNLVSVLRGVAGGVAGVWWRRGTKCLISQSLEGGMEEGVGRMSASVPWVFQFASEGVERCSHMTGGWGFNGLIKSLQVSPQIFHYFLHR